MVYRYTGDIRFLEIAKELADYFIDNLSKDYVPYWDFDSPDTIKDVSAAAIATSGLLELSTLVYTSEDKEKYWNAALNVLRSLCLPAYLAVGTNSSGILLHGVQNYNQNKGIDVSLIYADYYFIEAMLRYQKITKLNNAFDERSVSIPSSIKLFQNYPNPFNQETIIWYQLPFSTIVTLNIYDINGHLIQNIKESFQEAGDHRFLFNGEGFSSGTYFILLQAGKEQRNKKMILIK